MIFCLQLVAISVGVASVAVGIGIPVFYESQIDNSVSISLLLFFYVVEAEECYLVIS